ncbi:MAG: hypothetical protein AB1716_09770 [Planctomycetota bacterium]
MSFTAGLVSFQRFSIAGRMPEHITDGFVNALNRRTFGKVPLQSDQTQVGWIGPGHLFETELAAEQIACGRFARLGLRIDRLKPPPSVLRAYIRLEEEAALAGSGREFLGKTERRRAREAALLRADQEARSGAFRRMAAYDVLIDLERRVAYLGTTSPAVADQLMLLFGGTFGAELEALEPGRVAARVLDQARRARELESAAPIALVRSPEGGGPVHADGDLSFLGKEFLTWLWFRADAGDGPVRLASGDDATVMIDKTLRLKCDFGLTGSTTIAADGPADLPEARAALGAGKQPLRAGLVIGVALGELRLALDGPTLRVSSLMLPEPDEAGRQESSRGSKGEPDRVSRSGPNPRARLAERLELVADAAAVLDSLFEAFMLRRTGREWDSELAAMTAWAAGKTARRRLRAASV